MTRHPRRITITGSECVGKTTLATGLAQHFGVHASTEFAREYAAMHPQGIGMADHGPIAAGQVAHEDAVLAASVRDQHPILILDTDLLSTVAYAHHYTGQCDPAIEQMAWQRVADLYLVLDIDVPWVPDGIRDQPEHRAEVQAQFLRTLDRFQAPHIVIGGAWSDRFHQATQAIDRLLSS